MTEYLDVQHAAAGSPDDEARFARALAAIRADGWGDDLLPMLGAWQRTLADTHQRAAWDGLTRALEVMFRCGKPTAPSGPMIGVTLYVREADWLRDVARLFDRERSLIAEAEWLAVVWNATFANTGLWMGKTFEPVSRDVFAAKCGGDPITLEAWDPAVARLGRNFFREAGHRGLLQELGLPVLSRAWNLRDRPMDPSAPGFEAALLAENLEKERRVPYDKTGGYFLSHMGPSAVASLEGKKVYQLNYRWPALEPAYPLTRLVDELVQIADGIWLGQLVMASRRFGLGTLRMPLLGHRGPALALGEPYRGLPAAECGYQNNGWFLMIDPALAREAYADDAFPSLRPRPGEPAWHALGYDAPPAPPPSVSAAVPPGPKVADWADGWRRDEALRRKFTTFVLEPSPRPDDGDVRTLLQDGESILQLLARIQREIAAEARLDDHLRHFEKLNRLFRAGAAPRVVDGVFQGQGRGYNVRFDAPERVLWYGAEEPVTGFDHYHGATLNLHWGLADTLGAAVGESLAAAMARRIRERALLPAALAALLEGEARGPAVLDAVWATMGRFVFPWAGKSFQRISGRKLSMLLDESDDLARRYPARVAALESHVASWPHLQVVHRNAAHAFGKPGRWAAHLSSPWDDGMGASDREFWRETARQGFLFGTNVEDKRILFADVVMRRFDMNYAEPLPSIQTLAAAGPTPFVRHGYVFLGVADQPSILPMNSGPGGAKRVFQFHYRYPLIGGPVPIGFCLDELVQIADGLYLGQLIYSTALTRPFHSAVDPAEYAYQLFGYFMLLDHDWQRHRRAIGFDVDV